MPAIAPIEDLGNAQKELLEVKDIEELKRVFKKWRRIGWRMSANYGLRKGLQKNWKVRVDDGPYPKMPFLKNKELWGLPLNLTLDWSVKLRRLHAFF